MVRSVPDKNMVCAERPLLSRTRWQSTQRQRLPQHRHCRGRLKTNEAFPTSRSHTARKHSTDDKRAQHASSKDANT